MLRRVARTDPFIGRLVADRYRLIARLGTGGMATVYLARHVVIERLNAIKLLHTELATNELQKGRFLREARAVNRINHPNIVEILDYGESEHLVYLVMEYVPGEPLTRLLERGPIGWRRAAQIGLQVASALGRAHEMGVIHRDLKPANILLVAQRDASDLVKLTDFGVAKVRGAATLTLSSIALGTPGYLAPEYGELGVFDGRSDLFSLGVVLYEACSGVLPFGPEGATGRASSRAKSERPRLPERLSLKAPDAPQFFDDVVMTLLSHDPDDRPRDGFEAADLLRRAIERDAEQGALAPPFIDEATLSDRAPIEPAALPSPSGVAEGPSRSAAGSGRLPADNAPGGGRSKGPSRPHLVTVPFDEIGPVCSAALAKLEARLASAPTPSIEAAVEEARKLVQMVGDIGGLVAADHDVIESLRASGRAIRAELGSQLDDLARQRSKLLGWAGLVAERSDVVRTRRHSGYDPIPMMEAMAWEQAALDQEEDRARDCATELEERMDSLQAEIEEQNTRLEHEMLVAGARLEGRLAALRSVALEAWAVMEQAARRSGG
jgi:serine/threonine-protein kinase